MRADRVEIRDHRSVWGEPVDLPLGSSTTVLVGPNLAGKSNVVGAIIAALDDRVEFDLARERPFGRPDAIPSVRIHCTDREHGRRIDLVHEVRWTDAGRSSPTPPEDVPAGTPVVALAGDHPADVVARVVSTWSPDTDLAVVSDDLLLTVRRVLPEVERIDLGTYDAIDVVATDRSGYVIPPHTLRAAVAAALAAHLVRVGEDLPAVVVEEPEVFLHPAAQEALRDELFEIGIAADAPVLITTESPFLVPRSPEARIVAVARDDGGRTCVVGTARGDEPQAPLLGGLFRDQALAAVLDRTEAIPSDTRGVLIVEGGTDEAYLRLAARVLNRADDLERVMVHAAGGALPAALEAVVLRAETSVPVLALFDNDDPGRRARSTLIDRFGFRNLAEVATYAEVIPDHPMGAEAEDVFDWRLVARFVEEQGDASIRGKRILRSDEWHFDLTTSSKSAFVGWLDEHARPEHLERWGRVLDLLAERLPAR